jgi:alkanesulfonate monooxygenase SsuD/methylene tetrahydromethanopterin reductase-like flavin-dependent oxidoreductase (luciferase family)
MKIGIGLPNPVPDTPGTVMVDWARRAEERGLYGLATLDRIAYPSYDSLTTLAVAAGATTRIGLLTNILLAPAYPAVLLAKTAASIDQLSGGRLTLGLAPGGRADDFAAAGQDFPTRGRRFDRDLELLHRAWRGEPVAGEPGQAVGPRPVHGDAVPVLIGGSSEQTLRRIARWGAGWTAGGGGPEMAAPFADRVRAAWRAAGRPGEPRLVALGYFSLGPEVEDASRGYLMDYYAFLGPYAQMIADGAHRTADAIRAAVAAFADIGFDEIYFAPTAGRLDQVDRLADVAL